MKVWRLYVDGKCRGTYGDGLAAMRMAMADCANWYADGYTAEQVEVKHEEYSKGGKRADGIQTKDS